MPMPCHTVKNPVPVALFHVKLNITYILVLYIVLYLIYCSCVVDFSKFTCTLILINDIHYTTCIWIIILVWNCQSGKELLKKRKGQINILHNIGREWTSLQRVPDAHWTKVNSNLRGAIFNIITILLRYLAIA